jgi:hypothetical protein
MPVRGIGISPAHVAERLARFLWNERPDEALLARTVSVRSTDDVKAVARTMLADGRFNNGVEALFTQWLKLDAAALFDGDPEVSGQIEPGLRTSMVEESRLFLRDVMLGDGKLSTLLLASHTFADERLRKLYGTVDPPVRGAGHERVNLDPARRSGILTQASFLFVDPRTSARGTWILNTLLCTQVPSPPPDTSFSPLGRRPGQSYRQALTENISAPQCAACHQLVDPPGFALEHYDPLGRWRDRDNGADIDATGTLMLPSGNTIKFDGARQLGERLLGTCEVQRCMAESFLRRALAAELRASDHTSVEELSWAFAASGFNLRELLVAVTGSQSFLAP